MLKKCAFFVRGFMRMSTMVIVLILLVTYYFYQDKINEISTQAYQNNRQSGALFYLNGIWDKMRSAQKMQDDRTQNALDFTSTTKTVSDKAGSYSFTVPESWNVEIGKENVGGQISAVTVSSKAFFERNIGNEVYYDSGARFIVTYVKGEMPDAKNQDGGHGKMFLGKDTVAINGGNITYHRITDLRLKNGNIIDAHILHNGNTLEIRFEYNKEKLNDGEYLFQIIMNSLKFIDKK